MFEANGIEISRWIGVLGWSLIHAFWQGALIAALVAAMFRLLPLAGSAWRHHLALLGLVVMLVAWFVTLFVLVSAAAGVPERFASEPMVMALETEGIRAGPGPAAPTEATQGNAGLRAVSGERLWSEVVPAWLAWGWVAGVAVSGLRLLGAWAWLQRLRWSGTYPVEEALVTRVAFWARRLGLRRPVRVLGSCHVRVPAVIGWWRPVLLVPPAQIMGLTPRELEAVLCHELMHIRRNDYFVNLLQSCVEVLFFYHPGVWWLSRILRQEREYLCDRGAVAMSESRLYARALWQLARGVAAPPLLISSNGGELSLRIRRLLGEPLPKGPAPWGAGATILLLAGVLMTGHLLAATEAGGEVKATGLAPQVDRVLAVSYARLMAGEESQNLVLRPGDRIRVRLDDSSFVYIMGDLKRPGAYTVPREGGLTLLQLIASAHGSDLTSDQSLALLRRDGDRQHRTEVNVSWLLEGLVPDFLLQANDLVNVNVRSDPPRSIREVERMREQIRQLEAAETATTLLRGLSEAEQERMRAAYQREIAQLNQEVQAALPAAPPQTTDSVVKYSQIEPADRIVDEALWQQALAGDPTVTLVLPVGRRDITMPRPDFRLRDALAMIEDFSFSPTTELEIVRSSH